MIFDAGQVTLVAKDSQPASGHAQTIRRRISGQRALEQLRKLQILPRIADEQVVYEQRFVRRRRVHGGLPFAPGCSYVRCIAYISRKLLLVSSCSATPFRAARESPVRPYPQRL